jgi:hypothetical protein
VLEAKPGVLERYQLPAEARESLEELRALSRKAEDGDQEARKELRQVPAPTHRDGFRRGPANRTRPIGTPGYDAL